MLYANNEFEFRQLKRIIKTVMYLNRILQNGQDDEFIIRQFKNGVECEDGEKKFKESAI